ncbi:MAG: flagellar export chaperone FliS [Bdellovibrionales bacterium]|nr:flagellar export chaperone FliS [Bdellovibrionales bacterium]
MSATGYQKYKKTSIQSASREKLLLMLYEGAIRFCKIAIKAFEEKNISARNENIGRVYDIVSELNNTLDHSKGPEVAANLENLYMFMTNQLTKATIEHDVECVKTVLKLLETLYDGWSKAIEQLKREGKIAE